MAKNTKKSTNTNNTQPTKKSISLSKISYFVFIFAALVYLIQAILGAVGIDVGIVRTIQTIVVAILFCLVGYIGWAYARHRKLLDKIVYLVCIGLIFVAVILPIF